MDDIPHMDRIMEVSSTSFVYIHESDKAFRAWLVREEPDDREEER
jgi:hypothetical protein